MELVDLSSAMKTAFEYSNVRTEVANYLSSGKAQNEIVKLFGQHGGLNVIGKQGTVTFGHQDPPVEALVRFKLWMAVDILELLQKGKLTNTDATQDIYGAHKVDYDALVESARAPLPLTAICTLVYFVDPNDKVPISRYKKQISYGRKFARDFKTNQTDMACNALVGMLIRKHSEGELKHLSPHVKVSLLMDNVKSEQGHKVSLAAVWTEILPPTPNQPPAVLAS